MLNTQERQKITYFIGDEVEHTICYGMKTLFIIDTPPLKDIMARLQANGIRHAYFGTSQSFNPKTQDQYKSWNDVILPLLEKDYWVTLDFDVCHVEGVIQSGYCEYNRFVPMISCKIPRIRQLNYNTTLKVDDKTWGATNSGVWSVPLNALMQRQYYTHWDQYTNDTVIE